MMKAAGKKRHIIPIAGLIMLAAVVGFVYVRTHPVWREAELTIEKADRFYDIECIEPDGMTTVTRIIPPVGYERVPAEEGSFAVYLRSCPLLPDDVKLPVFDGSVIDSTDTAAVFDISLGDEGWQQCADSIIRLYSDYFYSTGQYDRIDFLFSDGKSCSYNDWRKGLRRFAAGGLSLRLPAAFPDDSKQEYMNYLKQVMRYAGTLSLQQESEPIDVSELRTGDIICNDAHVVLVVDEARNEAGESVYLIGQSFIPSVCFHIITWSEGKTVSPWFTAEQLDRLPFGLKTKDCRRWKGGF